MDDGYIKNGAWMLCTETFSHSGILILINMFKTKFDIQCHQQKRALKGWRIYIPKSEMNKVIK